MRRCRFACVGALLLALLLTGCGKAGTAPEDGGADFSETEQVETPEAADALTVKEIAQVNEAFAPFKERENVSYVNSVCSFFTSYYERPEDLDLVEFLRYMGIGGTVEDEAEFQALKGAGGWPFQGVDSLDPDAGAHPPVPADGAGRVPGGARRHHHGRPDECAGELRGAGVLAGDRRLLQLHQRRRPRHVHLRGRPGGRGSC